jgi:hypothetical protein
MSQPASLEEIDERLNKLQETLVVDAEDARAIAHLMALRVAPTPVRAVHFLRRPMVRLGAVAVTVAVVILLNLVAAYYAPTYSRAIADAPGIGGPSSKILAAAGLRAGDVTSFNDSASSRGHTLSLVAGYADGLRTVLFISIDGKGLVGDPKGFGMNPGDYGIGNLTLTDQFGHSYVPDGVGGATDLPFNPLVWPASSVGARLTLHVTAIEALWLRSTGEVQGDWTLHATLVASPVHTLPLPAPVRTPQASYMFTSVRSSATTLVIRWTVDGPILDAITRLHASNHDKEMVLEREYFWPQVFDTSGRPVQLEYFGTTFTKPATGEINVFIPGPGRYRIQLGDPLTSDDQQRWIAVP